MKRLLALAALTLASAGCFNVDKPTCSYACAASAPQCPTDYECRADGYCHLVGTTDACLFSDAAMPQDMSAAVGGDMASMPDMSSAAGDLASTD